MNITPGALKVTKTYEVTATFCFTEAEIEEGKSFTYEELLESMTVKDEEVVEIPEDMKAMIERYAGHTQEVVLAQVKTQLPNSGKSDEFIISATNQIRA